MNRYLLDTNHLSEAVLRVSVVRDRIQKQHRNGDVFGTCGPALCELMTGIVLRKDADRTRRRLEGLLHVVRIWPIDLNIADQYSKTYHELRAAGRALSQVDIMLAALSRHSKLILLTNDRDFEPLTDIQQETWIGK